MNELDQLKLQSYLDDELSAAERLEVESLLQGSDEARVVLGELRTTRDVLRGNEPERVLSCSREFYWNGIQREIAVAAPVLREAPGLLGWLRLHVAQLAGAAAAVAVVAFTYASVNREPQVDSAWEVLDPNTAMINYNDFDNNITVVMLYDQSNVGFTAGR